MVTDVRFYFYQAYLSVIDSDSVPLGLNCVYVVRSRLLTRQAADTFHDLVDSYIRYRNPFRRFSKRVLLLFYWVIMCSLSALARPWRRHRAQTRGPH